MAKKLASIIATQLDLQPPIGLQTDPRGTSDSALSQKCLRQLQETATRNSSPLSSITYAYSDHLKAYEETTSFEWLG